MIDRLYENMLILILKNRNRNCNRTLCNLNKIVLNRQISKILNCNRTLCNLNFIKKCFYIFQFIIVIEHYVI